MYAVIDIETTGGSARLERITEIAVYIHDGERIVEEYSTLINPERNIPYFITSLTGITNEMVEEAPRFYEVARKIVELTEDHVFVAHNARFDYSFIRQEFSNLGFNFKRPMLDTVSLSRKLLPGHRSYSLGNLCKDLGIEINGRHRAAGDALATVKLLELLIKKDGSIGKGSLLKNRHAAKLHPALEMERLKDIPEEPGIYYFHDENGDIIYVGKSRNLSQRISTHLSNNTSAREMEMCSITADITWERSGSELIALLMESAEIKSKKPRFNRAQRRTGFRWGIYSHTDEKGYIRFLYKNVSDDEVPLSVFTSRDRVRGKLDQVGLCRGACTGAEDPKSYNERALKALDEFIFRERNFFIIDRGRGKEERSAVKIVNGKYTGFGFFSVNDVEFGLTAIHDCIIPAADNRDIQVIIKSYLRQHKVERIIDF